MKLLRPSETLARVGLHAHTLPGALDARVAAGPERPFLVDGARTWTFKELARDASAAARLLLEAGVTAGDRVVVTSPTSAELVIALFAIARLGASFVPVSPELRTEEAARVIERSRPRVVLHGAAQAELAEAVAPAARRLDLDASFAALASLPALALSHPQPSPDDTCLVLFTSGTTGAPKGVMHAHRTFVVAGEGFVERQWLQPDDRMLCVLPMFHVNALFYSLGGALAAGATLILGGRFSASRFWPLVAESGATQANLLGSIGRILAVRPRSEYVKGHALDRVYCVPMPADVQRVFREELGVRWIAEGYGMSEVPGIFAQPYGEGPRVGAMGSVCRHPDGRPLGRVRVVDERGEQVPLGAVGTLEVKTELVMQGYFEAPDLTRAGFRDGYFITGDRVREVEPGVYEFVARDQEIIRRRGENVSAPEIDNAALACPGVAEAAAVAVPSELGEDDILLAVVARPGESVVAQEVHAQLSQRLSAAKVPRYVVVVADLPRGPTQRVLRHRLAADEALRRAATDFAARSPPAEPAATSLRSRPKE